MGEYRDHRFTPERTGIVDDGGCYYAPQAMLDERGRRLRWGWLREDRPVEVQKAAGRSGVMSVPTDLSLTAGGRLALNPVPALEALRGAHRTWSGLEPVDGGSHVLEGLDGRHLEIGLTVDVHGSAEFALGVLRSAIGAAPRASTPRLLAATSPPAWFRPRTTSRPSPSGATSARSSRNCSRTATRC